MSKSYMEGFNWEAYNKFKEMESNPIFKFVTDTHDFKKQMKELEDEKQRWQITRRLVTSTNEVTLDELKDLVEKVEELVALCNVRLKTVHTYESTQRSLKLYVGGQTVSILITGLAND